MSYFDSGHYQSRFFKFLAQQSQKVGDRCDRALRHLKHASVGATQVILYPLYLLLQTTRFASRQLHQTVQQYVAQLPENVKEPENPPAAQTPLQRLLSVTQNLSPVKADKAEFKTAVSVKAVTVADSSEEPTAIAPTASNLTPPNPQPELTVQTLSAVSDNHLSNAHEAGWQAGQQVREILTSQQPPASPDPFDPALQPLAEQDHLFPPLRRFWQLMAWVQKSPIARAANLFGESAIVVAEPPKPKAPNPAPASAFSPAQPIANTLTFLDRALADLEPLLPGVSDHTSTLAPHRQGRLQIKQHRPGKPKAISKNTESRVTDNTTETQFQRMQALIRAAIDYFFGPDPLLIQEDTDEHRYLKSLSKARSQEKAYFEEEVNSQVEEYESEEPWLTLRELFGEPAPRPSLKEGRPEPGKVAVRPPLDPEPTSDRIPTATALNTLQPPTVATKPDCLETEATLMGYVKHPLENLLEVLDRAMLWLEDRAVQLWNWAKQELAKILNKN